MIGRMWVMFMRLMAVLPLSWVRALGWLLGRTLFLLLGSRRRIAETNLRLCFPDRSPAARRALARQTFVVFAQTWLDRGWLWHAPRRVLERRLVLQGAVHELQPGPQGEETPTILLCPHFYGLDAAATTISMQVVRRWFSIYSSQSDPALDRWVREGRLRFGDSKVFTRTTGMKTILSAMRDGGVLYLLPDMDFGPQDSVFVPFYGMTAATLPSVPRFARLGRAKVVPVLPRLTPTGYTVDILPSWQDFPTDDVLADTALVNRRLEGYIDTMPAQYYWVHKRFKTRPEGEPSVY